MKIAGSYELQVVRNNKPVQTIKLNNTITVDFLEHLSQVFAGNVSALPKYVAFGLGDGTGSETAFYSQLQNEKLRVAISTHNNVGSGIMSTETNVSATTLQGASLTHITELGVFCVDDTHNEATVATTVNTGTLISRVVIDVTVETGDSFLIKRTDTITGG